VEPEYRDIIDIFDPIMSHPMAAVDSSCAAAVGYDEEVANLYVTFKGSGLTYVYQNVPVEEYEALVNAASVGTHFNRAVKDRYDFYPARFHVTAG
jgi:hypothetical protein